MKNTDFPFADLFGFKPEEDLTDEQKAGKAFLDLVKLFPNSPT